MIEQLAPQHIADYDLGFLIEPTQIRGDVVYFIQSGDDGPVKIGAASDVCRRLAEIQLANPEELHLRRALTWEPGLEAHLHRVFAAHRIRGEWFKPVVLDLPWHRPARSLPPRRAPEPPRLSRRQSQRLRHDYD